MADKEYGLDYLETKEELASYHILPGEISCTCCGDAKLAKPIAELFLKIRAEVSRIKEKQQPIVINSGYRCKKYQAHLKASGYKAANPNTAPHCYGVALDLQCPPGMSQSEFALLIMRVSKKDARIGWQAYAGQNFVHIDVAHKLKPNPSPASFKSGVTW